MQTVNRTYWRPTEGPGHAAGCDQLAGDRKRGRRKLQLEATDRLRLDVIVTEGQEVFSWAGASHFESRWVGEFIGEGPVGTGAFGTFLLDIFRNDGVSFEFTSTEQLGGKTMLQYSYQVPEEASHYFTRRTDKHWFATAFSGLLWVNPATDELVRLTVLTSQLPASTGACTADTRVEYQAVKLGTGGFLLPLESELHFLLRDGTESTNVTRYSKCREYLAESTLLFEEPSASAKPRVESQPNAIPVPNNLPVTLRLTTPIDTDTAAAGDVIAARVTREVPGPQSHQALISADAIVRGRIVRMERRLRPSPHFLISLSWRTVEDHNTVSPFFARIVQQDLEQAKVQARFQGTRSTVWLPPAGEAKRAGGWFIFPTPKSRILVPAGYESKWLTASPPESESGPR